LRGAVTRLGGTDGLRSKKEMKTTERRKRREHVLRTNNEI